MASRALLSGLLPGGPLGATVAVVGAGCADLGIVDAWLAGAASSGAAVADLRRPAGPGSVFSAPSPADSPLPAGIDCVVVNVDAAAIGRVIADRCERPLRVAALAGCSPYERLTVERAAVALGSRRGYLGLVPAGVPSVLVVTGSDRTAVDGVLAACARSGSFALRLPGGLGRKG